MKDDYINEDPVYSTYTNLNGELISEFEPDLALQYLLSNDILIVNNFWWKKEWPEDAQRMTSLSVNCSDTFSYACADAEELLYEELEELYQHVIKDPIWGSTVWCIKKRKLKPISEIFNELTENPIWKDELYQLFSKD